MKKGQKKVKVKVPKKQGKNIAVFFDLDKTLVKFNTAVRWGRFLLFKNKLPLSFVLTCSVYGTLYALKLYDFSKMLTRLWKTMENQDAKLILELTNRLYSNIEEFIYPDMKMILDSHRKKGHKVIIITQSFDFIAKIFAKKLKADAVAISEMEIKNGIFTGKVSAYFF